MIIVQEIYAAEAQVVPRGDTGKTLNAAVMMCNKKPNFHNKNGKGKVIQDRFEAIFD